MTKKLFASKNDKIISHALDAKEDVQLSVVTLKIDDDEKPREKWEELDIDELMSTGYEDTEDFYDMLTDMHGVTISNYIDDFETTEVKYDDVTKQLKFWGIFLDREAFQLAVIIAVIDDIIYPFGHFAMEEEIDGDDDEDLSHFMYETTFLNVGD